PWYMVEKTEDFDRILDHQLERLQVDCIDFYLIHAITGNAWRDRILPLRLVERMEKAREDGKVRHLGFSFHAPFPVFKEVIEYADIWDFCQIQLNYLDTELQAGLQGLRYAADRDLGVSIMEPLRGGYLADVPAEIRGVFSEFPAERSPVEWALDYLWNMPVIGVVLSGMSTMQHVTDNVAYASRSSAGMLSGAERQTIAAVVKRYREYNTVPCTGCEYCLPCPLNIAIPYNINVYNQYKITGDKEAARRLYNHIPPVVGGKASDCIDCGQCEPKCPQSIAVPEIMKEVQAALA
ncbi:MAG: aldo/keto reductase, partial [Planctomycetes bacterium]|nr:aldo/keto reductase [Planctomycetota bacterium]